MKRMMLLSTLFFFSVAGQSQSSWGLTAGVGITDLAMLNLPPHLESIFNPRFAYQGGVTFNHALSEKWNLTTELLYALKGAEVDESGDAALINLNLHYLSVPFVINYEILPKFFIGIGPEVSYRLKLNTSEGEASSSLELAWNKKWDFGLRTEIKYYPSNHFYTGVRYVHGLINIGSEFEVFNGKTYDILMI